MRVFSSVAAATALVVTAAALPASTPLGALTQLPGAQGCIYTPPAPEEEAPDPLNGVCALATSLGGVDAVAVSPDGRNVYVAAYDAGSVSALSRNAATGSLSQLPGRGGCIEEAAEKAGETTCADGTAMHNPTSIAVARDGRHVYVVSFVSDALVGFERGPGGPLTQLAGPNGCVSRNLTEEVCALGWGLDRALALALSPDGRNVYVASSDSSGVAAFSRESATGRVAQLPGADACVLDEQARMREDPDENEERCASGRALRQAGAVAVSPDGRNVYVASLAADAVSVFARDTATGKLTQLAGAEGCIVDMAASDETLLSCGRARGLDGPFAVAVSPDGRNVYAASGFGNNDPNGLPFDANGIAVFSRDARTGRLSQPPGAAGCVNENGSGACADGTALQGAIALAVSPDGRNVYLASGGSDAVAVFARARTTGALAQLPGTLGCVGAALPGTCAESRGLTGAYAVTVSPDGRNVYAAGPFDDAIVTFARFVAAPVVLRARLSSSAVRPRGDPDGAGSARLTFEEERVCWTIATRRVGRPTGVHVHPGGRSTRGPVVLALRPTGAGCRVAARERIAQITRRPAGHYLDVHTVQHPLGALRGQLTPG